MKDGCGDGSLAGVSEKAPGQRDEDLLHDWRGSSGSDVKSSAVPRHEAAAATRLYFSYKQELCDDSMKSVFQGNIVQQKYSESCICNFKISSISNSNIKKSKRNRLKLILII